MTIADALSGPVSGNLKAADMGQSIVFSCLIASLERVTTITSAADTVGYKKGGSGEALLDQPPLWQCADLWEQLQGLKTARHYPGGSLIFMRGQPVEGVYLLETGQLRVLMPHPQGEHRVFEVLGPGAILGVSETISGEPYKFTAETLCECEISFVDAQKLLNHLREHPDLCMRIVRRLSEDLHGLYHRCRSLTDGKARPRKRVSRPHIN